MLVVLSNAAAARLVVTVNLIRKSGEKARLNTSTCGGPEEPRDDRMIANLR